MAAETKEKGKPDNVGQNRPFEIDIIYNGVTKQVETANSELISTLLQKAIAAFGITSNAHLLAVFDQDGAELKDAETVKQAKVKKKDTLLLRPSAVKAG